jgi:hypothetical protein
MPCRCLERPFVIDVFVRTRLMFKFRQGVVVTVVVVINVVMAWQLVAVTVVSEP